MDLCIFLHLCASHWRRTDRFRPVVCEVVDAERTLTYFFKKMASYFDEHNCEPTNPDEQYRQNALLELARWAETHQMDVLIVEDGVLWPSVSVGLWCSAWTWWTRGPLTCRTGTSAFLLQRLKLQFRSSVWSSFPQSKRVTATNSHFVFLNISGMFLQSCVVFVQTKASSVLCVYWSLRNRRRFVRCPVNIFSTQDVSYPG